MGAPKEIIDLVSRFREQHDSYRLPAYGETQLRREFVDPFFKALGWDIDNEGGNAEAYKDVVHEDSIKVGTATRAPDYSFRIGGVRKFFVETKKFSVNVGQSVSSAFQLRRYGWSARLPLSILTDFEELAVYDCRVRPEKSDKASTARTLFVTYEQYDERWDEIAAIFSLDAIRKGSFDRYAESTAKKRGTAEVDDAFLKEIEQWRNDLARNLATRNSELSQCQMNFAVQKTIDRIIFLRICEDRGIEDYGALQSLINGPGIYTRLCALFRRADERYNSGLFHFTSEKNRNDDPDEWTLALQIDDRVLREIIRNLYYPESPYEFSVLRSDILGQVYEQFLGKMIRLTKGHQARIEDKPEVRKAGGVYYTPTYIVDYIVRQTVGTLLEGKTPHEVAGRTKTTWKPSKVGRSLKVLDPACGSGSFLIGAYQFLLDWYRDWYVEHGPEKYRDRIYQTRKEVWRLTTVERRRILLDHIYGVDIDAQAVEVTKLSLLLKVLEGENQETLQRQLRLFRERALPDLADNIKCGNSLIGPDVYQDNQLDALDEDERLRINAFDWQVEFREIMSTGGFDAVIGNPPYDVLEKNRGKASWPHVVLSEYVRLRPEFESALGGKLNLFRLFVVRSLQLVRQHGRFGNIIPLAALADVSCAPLRRHLMRSSGEIVCDCFPQKDNPVRRVFERAKLSTVVVTCRQQKSVPDDKAQVVVRVYPWNRFTDQCKEALITLADTQLLDPKNTPIPLVDARNWELCRSIYGRPSVMRLGDVGDFVIRRGEVNQTILREYITDDSAGSRLLKGVEIGRFELRKKLSQGKREWFDEDRFLNNCRPKTISQQRRLAIQRITGVDEGLRIVATIIDAPTYFADSTNSISPTPDSNHSLLYLLGLLNSKMFQWRFKLTSTNNNVSTNELESMPFRRLDFMDDASILAHNSMVQCVDQMLTLRKQAVAARTNHERTAVARQIESTDQEIDRLVYGLYGLTDEEIRIVENAAAR